MGGNLGLSTGAPQGLLLNSLHFLLLAGLSVCLMRGLLRGLPRKLAVAALNIYFFHHFVGGWAPWAIVGGLVFTTYLAAQAVTGRWRERVPAYFTVVVALALWAYLFLAKAPADFGAFNPFRRQALLVIGLSYMVFRCIGFVMDADTLEESVDLLSLCNYVLFFPTLLAGPLERFERFRDFQDGVGLELNESPLPALHRMANGFIKKFILADTLTALCFGPEADVVTWSGPTLWIGTLAQPLVLYLDFSGYCDIMIGLVRLMGFRMAENFNRPWLAHNIQEFWERWHITLSHFVRDYVFNPLSHFILSRTGSRWHFPLFMGLYFFSMLLIALWHALSWGFLMFGIMHGVLLVGLQVYRRYGAPALPASLSKALAQSRICSWLSAGFTYCAVAFSMVFWCQGVARSFTIFRLMLGA
jgi:alginate O-acetyltransferase complex protein AlgI